MAASNVLVGAPVTGTGGVLRAPVGTAVPTDLVAELDAAFAKAGYINEDGLTMTVDRSTEKIKAWGGDTVRVIQTDHEVQFEFAFLETNEISLKATYGDSNVTVTPATSSAGTNYAILVNGEPLGSNAWAFEIKDGDARIRIVVPNGQVTEVGETAFKHNEVTERQLTIEALPDETGNKAYMYIDDGVRDAA